MFTGLIVGTGSLRSRDRRGPGYRLVIGTQGLAGFQQLDLGESIAVSGACLTVVAKSPDSFDVDVSVETAEKTTLGRLALGSAVNLERALCVGDRLGGHWVSGHVDAVGQVKSIETRGEAWRVLVTFPDPLRRFVAPKGSITLDGVSLTVNEVEPAALGVMLIPHTRELTTLKHWRAADPVNIEVDLVARYLVSYFEAAGANPAPSGDSAFGLALERAGYK